MSDGSKILSETKLDLREDDKAEETCLSHSQQIRAKLSRWKSDDSKVVSRTIESFFKQKTEPTENHLKNSTEEFQKNELSISLIKCVESTETIEDNDEQEIFFELKQENVNDKTVETFVSNLNKANIELTEFSVDDSNAKNITDQNCLNVVPKKINNEEDNIVNLTNDSNIFKCENISLKVGKIDCDFSKVETCVNIEIDSSTAPKDRKCVFVETNLELIKQKLKNLSSRVSEKQKMKTRFYATIDPNKNQQAESELSREISKDMFSQASRSTWCISLIHLIFLFSLTDEYNWTI